MDEWIEERLSDDECEHLFAALFPQGFGGADVMAELAPNGWEASPWLAVFHPSVERVYEETVRVHQNIEGLLRGRRSEPPKPPPTFEEIKAEHKPTLVEPRRECQDLVGRCLWQVFSDNHEVIDAQRRVADIGSFRAAAGFLADLLNRENGRSECDYMDFYMGLAWLHGRADFTDAYAMIFRRLKEQQCDWIYHFPRLYLADMSGLREQLDAGQPDALNYDPSESFAREQEKQKHDEEVERMREELDDAHEEAKEEAKHRPPPQIVSAYRRVFGRWPDGWPP